MRHDHGWALILTSIVMGTVAGCGTDGGSGGSSTIIGLDAFVGSTEPPAAGYAANPTDSTGSEAVEPGGEAVSTEEIHPPAGEATPQPGEPIVIDSLVGQINGRPVFASEFFEPIDDQLRRYKEQLSPLQFEQALNTEITRRMVMLVRSELFLAEAQSRLTPEQQVGLFHFLRGQREEIIAERGGGSGAAAGSVIEENMGVTIDELVQDKRDLALVQMLYQQDVSPRIIVSWKDVERLYRQNAETFNPPASVVLAQIYLTPGRDDEKIEEVKRRLAAGEPFGAVAEAMGRPDGGVLGTYKLGPGGLADVRDALRDLYKEKIANLSVGQTTEPFAQPLDRGGEWIVWLHVVSIDQPPGRSLYEPELQMELRRHILEQERLRAEDAYFSELLADGVVDDLEEMEARLRAVGQARY